MKSVAERITKILKKYKYVAAVLLIGFALLLWPSGEKEETATQTEEKCDDVTYAAQIEARLEEMLCKVDGAGKVEVMLTLQSGARTQYQMDTQTDTDGERSSIERKTVILSEGSAYDEAAVSEVYYPQFQGALIVCEGADSASVRLNLIEAVTALTGLGSDRITVVKMK